MNQISINLLPRKQRKQRFNKVFILPILIAFILLIAAVFVLQWSKNEELSILESRLEQAEQEKLLLEQQNAVSEPSGGITDLESAITFMEDYPIPTVEVLDYLTELLPERGFFESFQYTDTGLITLTVQFDLSREAAFYLHQLEQSDRVAEASLQSMVTEEIDTEAAGTEEILPRYIAQYTVMLNKQTFREGDELE
ncbi:PilN domain-containing protein [Jeotgalibacillus sp. JSM ZJ347]|uniref:PilN domain-containing protein n=1 Tax=Jeotgalibacillus sp. JSM ZJ347 TaxID=3342117 RepID=UPI0035A867D5